MLLIDVSEIIFSTTQSITLFWAMDKATRMVLDRIKSKNYQFSVMGLRIHHWLVGVTVTTLGALMLSVQNLVMLIYEASIASIPRKLGLSTLTVGFRLFLDDLKDLKKQFKSFIKVIKKTNLSCFKV